MCGITGIFHFDKQRPVDQLTLQKMSDRVLHRGPDGEGFYINGNVGIAHRRLSIIDLSLGAQPMYSDDEKIIIVFNGEIYNYLEIQQELKGLSHRFKTNSDTEVIIRSYQQWGIACQEKFNGMWSLAIWDDNKKLLFITRDRLGEKPLNYGVFDNTFMFGSEIKSLAAYGDVLKPDTEMLELFLFLGYVPEPYTFYKHIKKLRAGHYIIVKDNHFKEYQYWELPEVNELDLQKNENEVVERFESLFMDAVGLE